MLTVKQVPHNVKMLVRKLISDGETDEGYIIAAALSAWPGMTAKAPDEHVALFHSDPAIILPMGSEK